MNSSVKFLVPSVNVPEEAVALVLLLVPPEAPDGELVLELELLPQAAISNSDRSPSTATASVRSGCRGRGPGERMFAFGMCVPPGG